MGAKKGLKRKLLMPYWENGLRNQENGYDSTNGKKIAMTRKLEYLKPIAYHSVKTAFAQTLNPWGFELFFLLFIH